MFKKPAPEELLKTARETLASGEAPHNERYVAAMVANATAIADRQSTDIELKTERDLLKTVYGDNTNADWRRLADDLRSGKVSEHTCPVLLRVMMTALRVELAISNPKFQE
jgi:hypothetical protein